MPLWRVRNTSMAVDDQKQMTIEVAYALLDKQWLLTIHLPYVTTIQNAIDAPGILDQAPEINLTRNNDECVWSRETAWPRFARR